MDLSHVAHLRPPPAPEPEHHPDPDVLRASEWLARGSAEPDAVVLGAPYAEGSISRARCDLAPAAIRRALSRFTTWSSDTDTSLEDLAVLDGGDVTLEGSVEAAQFRLEEVVRTVVRDSGEPSLVVLGGDNSITVACARAVAADALLTLDAHHDCRDPARGPSNGSPVRQLVEAGMQHVAQIGIHGFANAKAHADWAWEHGVRWVPGDVVHEEGITHAVEVALEDHLKRAEQIWVDIDLDVLDRSFAPGAPAALPGGLWPSDVVRAAYLLGRDPRVAGIDIVELDPTADPADATTRAACAIMLSFLAGVASL